MRNKRKKRAKVLDMECPRCGAEPGSTCTSEGARVGSLRFGQLGVCKTEHRERRLRLATALLGAVAS